jgi:hypothetical protein
MGAAATGLQAVLRVFFMVLIAATLLTRNQRTGNHPDRGAPLQNNYLIWLINKKLAHLRWRHSGAECLAGNPH